MSRVITTALIFLISCQLGQSGKGGEKGPNPEKEPNGNGWGNQETGPNGNGRSDLEKGHDGNNGKQLGRKVCEDHDECLNRGFRKHQQHQDKAELFDRACKHSCEWKEHAEGCRNGSIVPPPDLTPTQQEYFNSVCAHHQDLEPEAAATNETRAKRQTQTKAVRKEIRVMTDQERNQFFTALKTLKSTVIDGKSQYDIIIYYHTPSQAPEAHYSGAFLPYHRQLLFTLENALRKIDPTIALPYWASVWDHDLPNPADSILWTDTFLGNGNGDVTTGPFSAWKVYLPPGVSALSTRGGLYRQVSNSGKYLYTYSIFDKINYNMSDFSKFTWCVDPTFESLHGGPHVFVGGYMNVIQASPNDPIFFMHHAFIDSLYETWRFYTGQNTITSYIANSQACGQPSATACDPGVSPCLADTGTAQMSPFPGIKIQDGLSPHYTQVDYQYDYIGPNKAAWLDYNSGCYASPYLFINYATGRCVSKIRKGGNCTGFEGKAICYNSQCVSGTCQ